MKRILFILLVIYIALPIYSQQLPLVSHYWYDNLRTNPGSTGSKEMIDVSVIIRNDFMGFDNAPQLGLLNAEAPFKLFGFKHGVGISVNSDQYGLYNNVSPFISYAFQYEVGTNGLLGIGVSGGVHQTQLDAGELNFGSDTENTGAAATEIAKEQQDDTPYAINAGIFYRSDDIYFGLSALNLYSRTLKFKSGTAGNEVELKLVPHYCGTVGYNMELANPSYEFKPSIFIQTDLRSIRYDVNATLTYNKKIWGGVTYRAGNIVL
ncbi:MAG: PorP/SprF family type IX secretion system membrane protein, partial [Bacteroidales bacterium]|nr:PorP/SprF family type IX secretion system membrane protein [Bacteroidales bacterium]